MRASAYLVAGAIALLVIIGAVVWYYYAAGHQSLPTAGVSPSEINSIGSGYSDMNLPQSLGGEENIPDPNAITVDANDMNMDLPPAI